MIRNIPIRDKETRISNEAKANSIDVNYKKQSIFIQYTVIIK